MPRYRKVSLLPEMIPTASHEDDGSDVVVQATLHNCAHSIQTHLDFESIHSLLSEQEIVPLASDKSLMRIMPADTTQRQVNNLVIWLRRATGEQFLGFIAALRESDGGRPHDDLADTLEKEYKKLKDDPVLAKELANDLLTNPEFSYLFPLPSSLIVEDHCCASCCRIWELCCCKVWLFIFLGFCVFSITVCSITYILFQQHLAKVETNNVTPKLVTGISQVVVDLGENLHFLVSLTVMVNCSGSVFVKGYSDCSTLNETTASMVSELDVYKPSVHYLIYGSNLSLWYNSRGAVGIGNCFVVVKSLEGYKNYVQLCSKVMKRNCSGSDMDLVKKLCLDKDSKCVALPNAGESYFACFQVGRYKWISYPVERSDFYYFSIPISFPLYRNLKTVSYNTSRFPEHGFIEYPLQSNSAGSYSVKFPITRNSLKQPNDCIVLSTNCTNNMSLYDVSYEFEYTKALYYTLGTCFSVLGLLLVLIQGCCCFYRRKKEQVAEKVDEEDANQ